MCTSLLSTVTVETLNDKTERRDTVRRLSSIYSFSQPGTHSELHSNIACCVTELTHSRSRELSTLRAVSPAESLTLAWPFPMSMGFHESRTTDAVSGHILRFMPVFGDVHGTETPIEVRCRYSACQWIECLGAWVDPRILDVFLVVMSLLRSRWTESWKC